MFEHQTQSNSLNLTMEGYMDPVIFHSVYLKCVQASPQSHRGTKTSKKSDIILMSEALGFCLWS